MGRFARFGIVFRIARRNLFSHWAKNLIVGLIMIFGAALWVLGTALLDSMERTMEGSITGSIAGHLQVYSKKARDSLSLFGSEFIGQPDVGVIPDFAAAAKVLRAVPNVREVIPMGLDDAEVYTASELDLTIEAFRKALAAGDTRLTAVHEQRIRAMAALMKEEQQNRARVLGAKAEVERALADIERVLSDEFWRGASARSDEAIEFLDTRLAPLLEVDDQLFMRHVGTDLDRFARSFERFELVAGEMVPPGEPGLLLNQKFLEDAVKNRVARVLDAVRKEVREKGKRIAGDPVLENRIDRLTRQYRRVTFELGVDEAAALEPKLRAFLGGANGNLDELVQAFLRVTDLNLEERYAFFYREIAPNIRLYKYNVGDVITLRAFSRSGYLRAQNVRVSGVFRFKGLETSEIAGAHNLLDLNTFRDLYGMMTPEKLEELRAIRDEVGLRDVRPDQAEDALFGGAAQVEVRQREAHGFDELAGIELRRLRQNGKSFREQRFDPAELEHGMAVSAAVILNDPSRLRETEAAIAAAIAPLDLQVVDWQTASGIVGQLVVLVRVLLYVAISIIFFVAVVIMNNTMVIATLERTTEIGTIRAIGGQRLFVRVLFLLETLILGAVAALIGTFVGAGLVGWLGQVGLPAVHDVLTFLFSGPRLYPTYGLWNLITAWLAILGVSLLATFYPAFLATRIQPAVAMQTRE